MVACTAIGGGAAEDHDILCLDALLPESPTPFDVCGLQGPNTVLISSTAFTAAASALPSCGIYGFCDLAALFGGFAPALMSWLGDWIVVTDRHCDHP
jgi:hypothetical protein